MSIINVLKTWAIYAGFVAVIILLLIQVSKLQDELDSLIPDASMEPAELHRTSRENPRLASRASEFE